MAAATAMQLDDAHWALERQMSSQDSEDGPPSCNSSKATSTGSLPLKESSQKLAITRKAVNFSNILKVILIPARDEIHNKYELYWDIKETQVFREEAIQDIDSYAQSHNISPDEAQWELYQPDCEIGDGSSNQSSQPRPSWIENDITHGRVIASSCKDEAPPIQITIIEHNCQLNCDTCKLPCLFGINEAFW